MCQRSKDDRVLDTTACAALNSLVYVIGGSLAFKSGSGEATDIRSIDTLNPQEGWTQLPCMEHGRSRAVTAVFGSLIYVMGGIYSPCDPDVPWGYIFDTVSKQWSPLDSPKLGCGARSCAVLDGVGVVAYLPSKGGALYLHNGVSWELYHDNCGSFGHDTFAVSNGIFYMFDRYSSLLRGYDLVKRSWLPAIEGLDRLGAVPAESMTTYFHLVPIGNCKFCSLWVDGRVDSQHLILRYARFSVQHYPVSCARLEETKTFDINALALLNCIEHDVHVHGE